MTSTEMNFGFEVRKKLIEDPYTYIQKKKCSAEFSKADGTDWNKVLNYLAQNTPQTIALIY